MEQKSPSAVYDAYCTWNTCIKFNSYMYTRNTKLGMNQFSWYRKKLREFQINNTIHTNMYRLQYES